MQNDNAVVDTRELLDIPTVRGTSFDDLYTKSMEIQSLCSDYMVTDVGRESMRFCADSGKLIYRPDEPHNLRRSELTRYALSQLCNKLGVPIRYFEKCVDTGRLDLAEENINSWIPDYNRSLFIREYDNKIRGVLSDRYMTLDTPDILTVLNDVIDGKNYSTKGYFLSPERFHARVVQNEMMNIDGEDLFAGVQIDSSDVGRSTLLVRFMIFKLVCTNGLTISKGDGILFMQRHIGISADDFRNTFEESMQRIPLLMDNAKEFIELARKDTKKFDLTRFSESEMKDFTDSLKLKTRLSDEAMGKVIEMMQEKYTTTRWGLVNSLTEVAQDYTLERRVEIEKIAGDILLQVA